MPTFVTEGLNVSLTDDVSGTLPVANGGTGQTSFTTATPAELNALDANVWPADGSLGASSSTYYGTALTDHTKIANGDGVLVRLKNSGGLKWARLSIVCFLEGTKITLPDKNQINIEDLTLDDKVLTYNIDGLSELKDKTKISEWFSNSMKGSLSESGIRNIWINPSDSYLIINNKLRVTNHHLIHFKRNNIYYFNFAETLQPGDELLTDEEVYEPILSIDTVKDTINVYNFELDKDQTYFADNYLVHHYCKLCSGYSNII